MLVAAGDGGSWRMAAVGTGGQHCSSSGAGCKRTRHQLTASVTQERGRLQCGKRHCYRLQVCGEKGPFNSVGGNANQCSHYGEQCGDSLKNWK